jgi:hypothetical protein
LREVGAVSDYLPVPARLTVCGLVDALSFMDRIPERAPIDVGLNLILILQVAPAFNVVPHVLADTRNSEGLPVTMLIPVSLVGRLFFTVMTRAPLVVPTVWDGKLRVGGGTVTGATPVPVRDTECGLPAESSLIVIAAVFAPAVTG